MTRRDANCATSRARAHVGSAECVGATVATRVVERLGVLLADFRRRTRREVRKRVGELREEKEAFEADGDSGSGSERRAKRRRKEKKRREKRQQRRQRGRGRPPGDDGTGEGERSSVRTISS